MMSGGFESLDKLAIYLMLSKSVAASYLDQDL